MNYFKEAPISVTVCDKDGVILDMNDKSIRTFTKDGQPLQGNPCSTVIPNLPARNY